MISLALSSCGGISTKATQHKIKNKTSTSFATLQDIPQQCKDFNNNYKVVSAILSKSTYNVKAQSYQPIHDPKGFISTDFDNNGVSDLLFIERHGSNIRLISCINLKRKITPFKIHETIEADFQTISESVRLKGNSLVLSINRHEHNWGSDSETSHYSFHSGQLRLDQREIISSSGDGMRSDTVEFYDFVKRRFKKTSTSSYKPLRLYRNLSKHRF